MIYRIKADTPCHAYGAAESGSPWNYAFRPNRDRIFDSDDIVSETKTHYRIRESWGFGEIEVEKDLVIKEPI